LNLKVAPQIRTRMEELRDETGAYNLGEVVSKALALYDYVCGQKQNGAKILIEDADGALRELVVL